MDELKNVHLILLFLPVIIVMFVVAIIILIFNTSNSDPSIMLEIFEFAVPFDDEVEYTITSPFGLRIDPLDGIEMFHDGIDLAVPEGTAILSSLDGIVVEVGFQENGLGNYVYIEHNLNGIVFYTAYGHMDDDSIIVNEGQMISKKEKIGEVGESGRATGRHLHFTIMTPKLKFDKENLINPQIIFDNDLKEKETNYE